jgi:hypothetical protein
MLVAWQLDSKDYEWNIVVNATNGNSRYASVPFVMYNRSGTMTVDWGDGTTSSITSSNWQNAVHQYAVGGTYNVSVRHTNWNEIRIATDYDQDWNSSTSNRYSSYPRYNIIWYFAKSVKNILNPIPPVAGAEYLSNYSSSSMTAVSSDRTTRCMFYYCDNLESVPDNLFANFPETTDFYSCFHKCTRLKSIPSGLFDSNTAAASFQYCFQYCSSLQSIPSGLFDNNTQTTSFQYCFQYCSLLQSIPSGLFDSNTAATNFGGCFRNCTSLQSIPENLFANNTSAVDFNYCFDSTKDIKNFTLRIGSEQVKYILRMFYNPESGTVYVPENSTTYNTFINKMSSCSYYFSSITVIGE